jgi:hypothetical protein
VPSREELTLGKGWGAGGSLLIRKGLPWSGAPEDSCRLHLRMLNTSHDLTTTRHDFTARLAGDTRHGAKRLPRALYPHALYQHALLLCAVAAAGSAQDNRQHRRLAQTWAAQPRRQTKLGRTVFATRTYSISLAIAIAFAIASLHCHRNLAAPATIPSDSPRDVTPSRDKFHIASKTRCRTPIPLSARSPAPATTITYHA